MPVVNINFGKGLESDEFKEITSELEKKNDIKKVKIPRDRFPAEITLLFIKVVLITVPVIVKIVKALKRRGKEDAKIEFTCGEPERTVKIDMSMSAEKIKEAINKICG